MLLVNAGLLTAVIVWAARPSPAGPTGAVVAEAPPAPQPDSSIPLPAGVPKWLAAAEQAVAAVRATTFPPPVEAPVRPAAVTDAEWSALVRAADSVLTRLGGQPRLLDEATVVTAVGILDPGRGPFGQVYPRCERAYLREALIEPASRDPARVPALVRLHPVYRPLGDEDTRRALATRTPAAERRRLYARFADAARLPAPWAPLVPWEELPAKAMTALPWACERINAAGLRTATPDELGWLLAARAANYLAAVSEKHKGSVKNRPNSPAEVVARRHPR